MRIRKHHRGLPIAVAVVASIGVPTAVWACSQHGSIAARDLRGYIDGQTSRWNVVGPRSIEDLTTAGETTTTTTTSTEVTSTASGDFRTQTQGGWGSKPKGNNPGMLLENSFDIAFPDGLTVGVPGVGSMSFDSADAVRDYLPSGGPAGTISGDIANPGGKTSVGVLGGQLVAASVSVGMDDAGITSTTHAPGSLGDVVFREGPFARRSIDEVIDLTNRAIAGEDVGFTLTQLNEALTAFNENYVDGSRDNGDFELVTTTTTTTTTTTGGESVDLDFIRQLDVDGNQFNDANPNNAERIAELEAEVERLENQEVTLWDIARLANDAKKNMRKAAENAKNVAKWERKADSYQDTLDDLEKTLDRYVDERTFYAAWAEKMTKRYPRNAKQYQRVVKKIEDRIRSAERQIEKYRDKADDATRKAQEYAREAARLRDEWENVQDRAEVAKRELDQVRRDLAQAQRALNEARRQSNDRLYWVRLTDPLGRSVELQTYRSESFGRGIAAEYVLVNAGINALRDWFQVLNDAIEGGEVEENQITPRDRHG